MFVKQAIPEIVLVVPERHGDARGYFSETYRQNDYDAAGISGPFVQDNHALSRQAGTIRGLHFQSHPSPQAKLVRCTRGAILDVGVDLRRGSPSFGKYVSAELSAANGHQLYIPVGFAHGLCTLTPDCEVQYKVSGYYDPACDKGLAWDDPDIAIPWPLQGNRPVLSDRDTGQPKLLELPEYFSYNPSTDK